MISWVPNISPLNGSLMSCDFILAIIYSKYYTPLGVQLFLFLITIT